MVTDVCLWITTDFTVREIADMIDSSTQNITSYINDLYDDGMIKWLGLSTTKMIDGRKGYGSLYRSNQGEIIDNPPRETLKKTRPLKKKITRGKVVQSIVPKDPLSLFIRPVDQCDSRG